MLASLTIPGLSLRGARGDNSDTNMAIYTHVSSNLPIYRSTLGFLGSDLSGDSPGPPICSGLRCEPLGRASPIRAR